MEYDYTDLNNSDFTSYERHVIWRYENLGISPEQVSREDREIIKRYLLGAKTLSRKEYYDEGIYNMQEIENVIAYSTENYSSEQSVEQIAESTIPKKHKNQILIAKDNSAKKKE